MTRRRLPLLGPAAFAALGLVLGLVTIGWIAAPASAAPRARDSGRLLPTVRCPVETALDTVATPKVAPRERAVVPAVLAGRLAIYVGGPERVVAPRGWRCRALAAVNGGTLLIVEPRRAGATHGVRSWREPACVGCIFDATCSVFPKESRPLSVGVPCGPRPAGWRLTRLDPTLVRYRSDDGETGLVYLDATAPEAAGVSCRAPGAGVCSAVLTAWQ